MSAHKAYANKVLRAIVAQKLKTLGEIEVTPDLTLTDSNMEEMNNMFGEVTGGGSITDALLEEFIAEADDDLEQLIQVCMIRVLYCVSVGLLCWSQLLQVVISAENVFVCRVFLSLHLQTPTFPAEVVFHWLLLVYNLVKVDC